MEIFFLFIYKEKSVEGGHECHSSTLDIVEPDIFDRLHDLNSKERKIPGLLTVNSQVSKLFQIKVNEVYLQQIDELVRFQNIYINLIKWDELETFL